MTTHSPSQAPDKAGVVERARKLLAAEWDREAAANDHKGYYNAATNCRQRAEEVLRGQSDLHAVRALVAALSPPPVVEEAGLRQVGLPTDELSFLRLATSGKGTLAEVRRSDLRAVIQWIDHHGAPTATAGEEEVEQLARRFYEERPGDLVPWDEAQEYCAAFVEELRHIARIALAALPRGLTASREDLRRLLADLSQAPDKAGVVERARKLLAAEWDREAAANDHKGHYNAATNCRQHAEEVLRGQSDLHAVRALVAALSPPPVVEEAGLRATHVARFASEAESIVNSLDVSAIYAAPEWCELHEDGQMWAAAIVREAFARAAERAAPTPTAGEEEVEQILERVFAERLPYQAQRLGVSATDEDTPLTFSNRVRKAALLAALPRGLTIPDELRELSEKATEGPWIVHPIMAWVSPAADLDLPICQMRMATDGKSSEAEALATAAFIAALENWFRQALDQESSR